jgi:hypothetical protein
MNTAFDFSRFLKVLSNEWRLNLKKMLLFWGGIIIITILYFVLHRVGQNMMMIPKNITLGLSFFLMCISQGFYLQLYYHEFSSKGKTQALFLLPASRSETFWAKFLLSIVLYLILFSTYILTVLKFNEIYNEWVRETINFSLDDPRIKNFESFQTLYIDLTIMLMFFLVWLFSASAYLLGIISFKKQSALKSLALCFVVIMSLVLITCIVYFLFTGVWPSIAVPGIVIDTKGDYYAIFQMYPGLLYSFGIFICLTLIFISRIKYNEKTI